MAEEAKELPPIVMVEESAFVIDKLDPALAEMALAADVVALDKAQTKTLLVNAIGRGDIPDDDFVPIFDAQPKFEEDKEPIAI